MASISAMKSIDMISLMPDWFGAEHKTGVSIGVNGAGQVRQGLFGVGCENHGWGYCTLLMLVRL